MKKYLFIVALAALFSGCANEFNKVYKTNNYQYKYEYAKECFVRGKYTNAITLLTELLSYEKGTENGEESLYMYAMALYNTKDYANASAAFKKYVDSYPKGQFTELAKFNVGQSLYMSTPEPRLDQSQTVAAIGAFQDFLDAFPESNLKETAQKRLFELQDKLVRKEYYSAKLYYDLGSYFGNCTEGGNNYEACIVTAQNALKDYPYTSMREDFAILIMKSKFELAEQSVEAKKLARYEDAEEECYGFINEYPDSPERATAERYIEKCKRYKQAKA